MSIFKKTKKEQQEFRKKTISGFKDAVKELNELYDDARTEYDSLDTVINEFEHFIEELNGRLTTEDRTAMEGFLTKLNKVQRFARNSVRDVRDVLRNQKKRLKEIQNEI